jgi:hypothetical protein
MDGNTEPNMVIRSSLIDLAQQSTCYMMTETYSRLRNVGILIKLRQWIMFGEFVILTAHNLNKTSVIEYTSSYVLGNS